MDKHEQSLGLDLDKGAQRLGIDRKRLETMFPTLLRDQENIPQRVREARESSDYRAIEGWAHKVKGTYFYLGADELQARAEALETRIREETTAPAEEIEEFCKALQTTLDWIRGQVSD